MMTGRINFFPDGSVEYGDLAKDTRFLIGKQKCTARKNTQIYFYQNGLPERMHLSKPCGILIKKTKYFFTDDNYGIEFYADGAISAGVLAQNGTFTINGSHRTIQKNSGRIGFFPDGNVKYITGGMSENFRHDSAGNVFVFNAQKPIQFYEDGIPHTGLLLKRTPIKMLDKNLILANAEVTFDRAGCLMTATLAVRTRIAMADKEVEAPAKAKILFYGSGAILGIGDKNGDTMNFDEQGKFVNIERKPVYYE